MPSKAIFQGLIVTGLALGGGLAMDVQPAHAHPQVVVEYVADEPPEHVERYPHTHYGERDVYWARGHWYYQRGPHWYYYRHEPPPLYRHRVSTVERPRYQYRHRPERRIEREAPAHRVELRVR